MGLSRTVSKINNDFSWKLPIFPCPRIYAPLEFCNSGSTQKTRVMPIYMTMSRVWWYMHWFRYNTRVWLADGQTYRFAITISRSASTIKMLARCRNPCMYNNSAVTHIVCKSQSPQVTNADWISGLRKPWSSIHLSNSWNTDNSNYQPSYC